MKRIAYPLLLLTLFIGNQVIAADEPGTISQTYLVQPRAGHAEKLLKAIQRHLSWLKENGETWNWDCFQVATGDKVGSYLFVTGGHHWKDLDNAAEFRMKSSNRWRESVSEHVKVLDGEIHQLLPEFSRMPNEENRPANRMAVVTIFHLRPLADQAFLKRFSELSKVMGNQDSPLPVLGFQHISGGESKITFVHPLRSWSDYGIRQERIAAAVQSLGPKAQPWTKELRELTTKSESFVIVRRPELSLESPSSN